MNLSELFFNRFLYKTPQSIETQDSTFLSGNATPATANPVASGNAVYDINTNSQLINGAQLNPQSPLPPGILNIANYGWTQTCNFTVVNLNTVSWSSGTFTSADGTSIYSIGAGSTGAMSAKTYIYLDIAVSVTAYQISTSITAPIGIGKVLIAVCQNGTASATYNLVQASQIVGDNILANSIGANKIVAGSITANEISSSYVYAGYISANMITAGTITGSTLQTASSGQRVIIDGGNNDVRFYDSNGTYEGRIVGSATGGVFITGVNYVSLAIGSTNYMYASGSTGVMVLATNLLPVGANIKLGDYGSNFSSMWTNSLVTSSIATNGGQIGVTGGFYPETDSLYDLGNTTYRWSKVWADEISGGVIVGTSLSAGSGNLRAGGYHYFNSGNDNVYIYSTGSNLSFKDGTGTYASLSALKTAVVPTSKGYNALYCTESPEVWFMDFVKKDKKLDSMFKEVTVSPYHYIKCVDGGYQVWGKRAGYAKTRFESKTHREFLANEKFLNMNKPT